MKIKTIEQQKSETNRNLFPDSNGHVRSSRSKYTINYEPQISQIIELDNQPQENVPNTINTSNTSIILMESQIYGANHSNMNATIQMLDEDKPTSTKLSFNKNDLVQQQTSFSNAVEESFKVEIKKAELKLLNRQSTCPIDDNIDI